MRPDGHVGRDLGCRPRIAPAWSSWCATTARCSSNIVDQIHDAEDAGDEPRLLVTRWSRRGLRVFGADRDAQRRRKDPRSRPILPLGLEEADSVVADHLRYCYHLP